MANNKRKNRDENGKFTSSYTFDNDGKKKCSICSELKSKENYRILNKETGLREARCRDCFNLFKRKWRKTKAQKEKNKEYYQKNKKKIMLKKKEWIKLNHDRYKEKNNANAKKRRESEPNYRIRSNLSRRINHALSKYTKEYKVVKSSSTLKLLGCKIDDLKSHLEKKFTDGMSWDNYPDWEIDHIIPCDYFNLEDEFEQKLCFNYLNLQPLWKSENIKKSNKIDQKKISKLIDKISNSVFDLNE